MLTSATAAGWAFVKAKWIVSMPLVSYLMYGRWPETKTSVRAGDHVVAPSAWVENVGLWLPPRQNR